jgi:putative ABC transport system ATP-binding protein
MPNALAIRLKEIVKTYKDGSLEVPVLRGVSLDIKKGELVAIMGPSGSGKSTVMNMIGLLDRPTGGKLWLDNQPLHLSMSDGKLAAIRAERIGFVFQSFNLLPRISALANVLMPSKYLRHEGALERAKELLISLGLEDRMHHLPTQLSGGEKQRVAIARALINNPDIILADEPTGNLDSFAGFEVMKILMGLKKEGKTVLIVTHDPRIAKLCDRTVHIMDGKVE